MPPPPPALARAAELNRKRRHRDSAAAAAGRAAAGGAPQIAPAPGPGPSIGAAPSISAAPGPAGTGFLPGYAPFGPPAGFGGAPQEVAHKILFVQGLPEDVEQSALCTMFQQFPGFREVRLVAARPGIAFVEFEAEPQAGAALLGLQGFKVGDRPMAISFAKR